MKLALAALALLVASATGRSLSRVEQMKFINRVLQNVDEADEITISSNHSLQFHTCISMTTELSNNMKKALSNDEVIKEYYDNGQIVPLRSYVLFNVCVTDKCAFDDESNLFVTDLQDYMGLMAYKADQSISYCGTCVDAMEWCMYVFSTWFIVLGPSPVYTDSHFMFSNSIDPRNGEGNSTAEESDVEEDAAGRERRLDMVDYVDCDTCAQLNCFDAAADNRGDQIDDGDESSQRLSVDDLFEWADDWTKCQRTGVEWNGIELYGTFLCNADGSGVELGVFLDKDCTTYSKVQSFSELFPDDAYYTSSGSVVTYPFTHTINCAEEVQWASPEDRDVNEENAQDGEVEQQNAQEQANQYCQAVIQSNFAYRLSDCDQSEVQEGEVVEDEDLEEQPAEDDEFAGWTYDISQQDAEDASVVCTTLKAIKKQDRSYRNAARARNQFMEVENGFYSYKLYVAQNRKASGMFAGFLVVVVCACAAALYTWKTSQKKVKVPLLEGQMQEQL